MAEKKSTKKKKAPETDNPSDLGLSSLLGSWKDIPVQVLKYAAENTLDTTNKLLKTPEQLERLGKAGKSLKDLREVAGISIEDLSEAIDLENVDLLQSIEEGKAAVPFEILLRLASYYARNDPIPFIMKYSRVYSPGIWRLFKTLGIERLLMAAERELQFIQIYRSRDAARDLTDEGFKHVYDFTQQAFDLALHFVSEQEQIANAEQQADPAEADDTDDEDVTEEDWEDEEEK